MTSQEVKSRANQLQAAMKIIAKKCRELKADLGHIDPKPDTHLLNSMHSTLFHIENHADDLYTQLQKL